MRGTDASSKVGYPWNVVSGMPASGTVRSPDGKCDNTEQRPSVLRFVDRIQVGALLLPEWRHGGLVERVGAERIGQYGVVDR